MPFHPGHHRAAPWQLAIIAIVIGLLLVLYLWSFRAGGDSTLDAPAVPGGPVVPPSGPPAPPAPPAGGR